MDNEGATAQILVMALISDLQAKGLVSSAELARALSLFVARDISPQQRDAAENALAVLQGMTGRMAAG
jgi:hypothetical protein